MKAYYIIRRARKKRAMKIVSFSLSLSFSLCIYKAKHNDLNYVHSTLIKEGKGEEEKEEAFYLSFSSPLKKCYSNRDSQVEERTSEQ